MLTRGLGVLCVRIAQSPELVPHPEPCGGGEEVNKWCCDRGGRGRVGEMMPGRASRLTVASQGEKAAQNVCPCLESPRPMTTRRPSIRFEEIF